MCRPVLGCTQFHGVTGSLHFCILAHLGLAEHGQRHRRAPGSDPVGDPYGRTVQCRPELTQPTAQVTGVWLAQRGRVLGEKSRVLIDLDVVLHGQAVEPGSGLRLNLDHEQRGHACQNICRWRHNQV